MNAVCGIIGAVALTSDGLPLEVAAALRTRMRRLRHRGPDDDGFMVFGARGASAVLGEEDGYDFADLGPIICVLGHLRLSIIDLSRGGRQPMTSASGRSTLVFNGEIYNYQELKQSGIDVRWRSTSDTEVLLEHMERDGIAALNKLNGMFAFAHWSNTMRTLTLVRDRVGIKPLFCVETPAYLAFASEPHALLALPGTGGVVQPSATAVANYLTLSIPSAVPGSFFADIREVEPGTALVFRNGRSTVRRWYEPPRCEERGHKADVGVLRELLFDAVRLRLRSDVPVGACLSGGLDSSILVEIATHLLRKQNPHALVRTFTARSDDPVFDETAYAQMVVDDVGGTPTFVTPERASDDNLWSQILELVAVQQEPVIGLTVLAQQLVMRAARDAAVPVLIDGQGADELFLGYHWHVGTLLLQRPTLRSLRAASKMWWRQAESSPGYMSALAPLLTLPPLRKGHGLRRSRGAYRVRRELLNDVRKLSLPWTSNELRQFEIWRAPLQALLRYEDRNSMRFAIETRLPFLDYRILEFVLRCPTDELLSDGRSKSLLRRAADDLLPPAVRERRRKLGFPIAQDGVMARLRNRFADAVAFCDDLDSYVDRNHASRLIRSGKMETNAAWRISNLALWLTWLKGASRH